MTNSSMCGYIYSCILRNYYKCFFGKIYYSLYFCTIKY